MPYPLPSLSFIEKTQWESEKKINTETNGDQEKSNVIKSWNVTYILYSIPLFHFTLHILTRWHLEGQSSTYESSCGFNFFIVYVYESGEVLKMKYSGQNKILELHTKKKILHLMTN